MNSLSRMRLSEQYSCLQSIVAVTVDFKDEEWAAISQKELFDLAMKHMRSKFGKTVNPSVLQSAIENLEKFQLPRNVQEQEHVNVEI